MKENLESKTETGNGRIPLTDLPNIQCPIKKRFCEVRGNYYKCYFKDYNNCKTYNKFGKLK